MHFTEKARLLSGIARTNPHITVPLIRSVRTRNAETVRGVRWDGQEMRAILPYNAAEFAGQVYEPEITAFLEAVVPQGGIAVDVGAHFGMHTLTLSRVVGPTGSVYAFEPSPDTVTVLRSNTRPASASDTKANILVKPYAINDGTRQCETLTQFNRLHSGINTITANPRVSDGLRGRTTTTVNVPAVSLDAFFLPRNIDGIDCIKIDAENAEMEVLQGGHQVIGKFAPVIVFEGGMDSFKAPGTSSQHCVAYLRSFGYTSLVLEPDGTLSDFDFDREYVKTINIAAIPPGHAILS